jgi:hypothetical protein
MIPLARVGLSLYLILAMAAGPWLCCCTPGRSHATPSPAAALPPASHGCCCCGGGATSTEDHAHERGVAAEGRAPRAPDSPCPCKSGSRNLPGLVSVDRPGGVEQGGPHPAPHSFDGATIPGTVSPNAHERGPVPDESSTFPLRGRDILRALHILRC